MENFTASDERGWKTITRVIDQTDYYVLILAGRYGSIDPKSGKSWTHLEYDYARSKSIPVLGFLREDPSITADKMERDPSTAEMLKKFREHIRNNHLVSTWATAEDLSSKVASAIRNHIEDDEHEGHPRPGWYRGDEIPSSGVIEEFARLSSENASLKEELAKLKSPSLPAKLHLIDPHESQPFAHIESTQNIYAPSQTAMSRFAFDIYSKQKSEFVDYKNRTLWLYARITNSGGTPARNVVIDFTIENSADVILFLPSRFSGLPYAEPWQIDKSRHCYVDSYSPSSVRQRIKLVAPGLEEDLVPLGIVAPQATLGGHHVFKIKYNIVEESGISERGEIMAEIKWNTSPVVFDDENKLDDAP